LTGLPITILSPVKIGTREDAAIEQRYGPGSRVLTLGETCVLLDPVSDGPPGAGSQFRLRVSGSESNVSIGLSRLGVPVRWISRVSDDPMGEYVWRTLLGEGLDLEFAVRKRHSFTGLAMKVRDRGHSALLYYRRGSAAASMQPTDVPNRAFQDIRVVHLTGITPALGSGPRNLVRSVARRAQERGLLVTLDVNFRPALWPRRAAARAALRESLPFVDWALCGIDEGRAVFGGRGPEDVGARVLEAGARGAIVRDGGRCSWVIADRVIGVPVTHNASIVDDIGGGDAFDAGFIYGLLRGIGPDSAAAIGNLVAAEALQGTGDWETLPYYRDIKTKLDWIGGAVT
jgi:2-dehydro-3-deoxygluconokinase